ncbi:MAG TPA: dienelactone hydrolase family protein [Candidatus Nanopelagicaceae bacterium]|nr:dienelactone hydrolase family protein [Candidatus Nanopelagicaceae bacterium]
MMRTQTIEVAIATGDVHLQGLLALPYAATGIVAFAHGSGSSRFSGRNQRVAQGLNQAGLGTLLFDLLTSEENETDIVSAEYRFNIELLTERLVGAVKWLNHHKETAALHVGLFGSSTGAAAALQTAAELGKKISAVVSRGGRPDLAGSNALGKVQSPTLLLVGGLDNVVLDLNRESESQMQCKKELVIIPGATHLFEEPGTLEEIERLTADWFTRYLK